MGSVLVSKLSQETAVAGGSKPECVSKLVQSAICRSNTSPVATDPTRPHLPKSHHLTAPLVDQTAITMDSTRKLVTNTEHGSNNSSGQLGCPQVFAIFNSADMYQHLQMCPEQRGLGPDRSIAPGFSLQPSPVSQLLTLTQTREFLASSGC